MTDPTLFRRWLRQGSGTPLVLIHGLAADHHSWRPFIAANPLGRPVLAVDLPGHGASPPLPGPSMMAMADAVRQVLDEEGVHTAHIAGHSLGGGVAALLADKLGAGTRSLLLVAPAGLAVDVDARLVAALAAARDEETLTPILQRFVADPTLISPAFVRMTAAQRADGRLPAQQSAVVAATFPPEGGPIPEAGVAAVRAAIARQAAPVRVVIGAQDAIVPPRQLEGLPGTVARHILPDVGHLPHLEARLPLGRILRETIRSGEPEDTPA